MPELPEVETIRADLSEKILKKKIISLKVKKPKIVKTTQNKFKKALIGFSFSKIDRIGKLLIFVLEDKKEERYLLIHLKMTGQLVYVAKSGFVAGGHSNSKEESRKYKLGGLEKELPNKYSHIIFGFEDSSTLFFNDMRQFGYMKIVNKEELVVVKERFGIEPLQKNFTWSNFQKVFKGKKTNVKAFLLKQDMISGLGNIYVDEVLFASGVSPTRLVSTLSSEELKALFKNSKKIIKKAIKFRGTTFSDYVDTSGKRGNFADLLNVYGKEKTVCPKCKRTKIIKIKVAGRGTRLCPRCQQ